jgi:hypothetical protein
MKQITLILIIVIVLAIVGTLGFILLQGLQSNPDIVSPAQKVSGIQVSFPTPNTVIKSPLKITGAVSGKGWTGFEGQVGTVKLFDANGNQLALGILTATTDWMMLPVQFQTTLVYVTPVTPTGSLVFYNENPSGDPAKDKTFTVPVNF